MNTNQSGSLQAPRSNASGMLVAGNADQQSNGANQYGNGQEIDQPTGIGYAMQWKRSNEDYDQSQCDSLNPEASGVHENFAPEVKISAKTGDKAHWKLPEMKTPEMETMGPVADRQTLREILEVVLVTTKRMMTVMLRNNDNKVSYDCTLMSHYENTDTTDITTINHQDSL